MSSRAVNCSSGGRTPVNGGSSGGRTPVNGGSSGARTPVNGGSSGARTPVESGARTPVNSGSRTPVESGARTPVNSGARTPEHGGSSGSRTPLNSGARTPVDRASSGARTPVDRASSSGARTPVDRASSNVGRTRVGKYELGRTIGEGNFAKVKIAKHVERDDPVAIKILDKEKILKHKMIGQIKREISTMKLIRHPNVIRMHEVMASRTKIYIVMDFITGGELFDKIARSGRLKEDEARKYFQQLICAVDYCHSRGVCHRDLKPENLLLDNNGNLKVSDFGLSALPQQVREDGLLHTTCGTPNYVAPEVIHNKGYDGPKADLWSCGVILFVLMAGYLPFEETNLMALYKKIFKAEFTCPPWFSSSAKKLIKRILDPNPTTRITIAEVIENEWFKKGYKPPMFEQADTDVDDVNSIFSESESTDSANLVVERREEAPVAPVTMNAFELISKSQGLNLSCLFEKKMGLVKRETRFTSKCSAKDIISKIEETAGPLGFDVKKNNCKLRIYGEKTGRKGHLSVATEILEVAPSLYMVEMRKSEGDTLEFHKFYKNLSTGLKDIVWKADPIDEEEKDGASASK